MKPWIKTCMGFQNDEEKEKILVLQEPKRKDNPTHKGWIGDPE